MPANGMAGLLQNDKGSHANLYHPAEQRFPRKRTPAGKML